MWKLIRKRQQRKSEEGFTLIELIVVVAILGFLLAIAIPRYTTARQRAAANASAANLKNFANALELYGTEQNILTYPTNDDWESWVGEYLQEIPEPPGDGTYTYYQGTGGEGYTIFDSSTYGDINGIYVRTGGLIEYL